MPTTDYSNTIIYKIVCENECYVGHTTNFINRKYKHKIDCNRLVNKLYQFICDREWTMTPIEEFPCENKTQARIREDYWIQELKPNLNSNRAFCSAEQKKEYDKQYKKTSKYLEYDKQYREHNKKQLAEHAKKYRVDNKEKIKEYKNKTIICECGAIINQSGKSRHKNTPKHKRLLKLKNDLAII
jgi:hypothetical protein